MAPHSKPPEAEEVQEAASKEHVEISTTTEATGICKFSPIYPIFILTSAPSLLFIVEVKHLFSQGLLFWFIFFIAQYTLNRDP